MDIIGGFLDKKLITNHNTRKTYRCNINKFFNIINKDINTYFKQKPEKIEKDLETVFLRLKDEHNTSLIVLKTIFNSVKQFMFTIDKRTKTLDFWDTLKARTRNASPVSDDETPNNKDIKKILQHGNTRARAMFLIQASTGCRIGELIALYPDDIKLNENPVRVTFNKTFDYTKPDKTKLFTKNKSKHDAFLTQEAVESYKAYMKERTMLYKKSLRTIPERYRPVKITGNKELDEKNLDEYVKQEKRIFPITDNTARLIWFNMVKKTDLYNRDSNTNRLTVHPHCLRKFFRSYLKNVDLAEHLMGHGGYLTSYRDMKKEDLGKEFMKYAKNVTIFGSTVDSERLNSMQDQLNERNKKIEDLISRIDKLETLNELLEVKSNQSKLKQELQKLKEK